MNRKLPFQLEDFVRRTAISTTTNTFPGSEVLRMSCRTSSTIQMPAYQILGQSRPVSTRPGDHGGSQRLRLGYVQLRHRGPGQRSRRTQNHPDLHARLVRVTVIKKTVDQSGSPALHSVEWTLVGRTELTSVDPSLRRYWEGSTLRQTTQLQLPKRHNPSLRKYYEGAIKASPAIAPRS
ncbi:hypothetical protein K469DRAFT_312704 [Zopfia rhizophila CBS 207.26]|uniref:Uncharacterized protein n=1 Tax=Zopfia rhizophila CBS 207.26 TaxID=1314779 RepID=A0A6A6EMJ1_9PEZI|nr:hypothetical protein K469DRAFT_312704 [Zopfia rhizophila CBS 207.26]